MVYDATDLNPRDINFDGRVNDTAIPGYVAEIYTKANPPRAIVADFGRHPDGSWSLIEFNEPWCSGIYYCDADKCFDCIIKTQEAKQDAEILQ